MIRKLLALVLVAVFPAACVHALDLPITINFQLGFNVDVVPSPNDTSQALGLVVVPDKILTDKIRDLTITGTIINHGSVAYSGIDMRFAVTSYVGTGVSRGQADVTPNYLPPGASAHFVVRVSLDSERPRQAMYTITAAGSQAYAQSPASTSNVIILPPGYTVQDYVQQSILPQEQGYVVQESIPYEYVQSYTPQEYILPAQ